MTIKKTKKVLKLPMKKIQQIADELKVSKRTVQRAMNLTFPTTGMNADRARVRARALGAVEVTDVYFIES